MRTELGAVLAVGLLIVFGGVLGACGGGDGGGSELTLDEFFQRVQELDDNFSTGTSDLNDEFNALTADSSVDEAADLVDRQAEVVQAFVDGLDDLNPPEEAAGLQDDAVAAGRDVVDAFRAGVDAGRDTASVEEFFSAFDTNEMQGAFDRFAQVCNDAEQFATDNGITVDFSCGEA